MQENIHELSRRLAEIDAEVAEYADGDIIWGYISALGATISILRNMGGFNESLGTLDKLLMKLADVAAGNNAMRPVRSPGSRGGRPPQGFRHAVIQGRAAAIVELLISLGEDESDACREVARVLAKGRVKGRQGGNVSASTVREWRSQCGRHGDKTDAKDIYNATLDALGSTIAAAQFSPREAKSFLIKGILSKNVSSGLFSD